MRCLSRGYSSHLHACSECKREGCVEISYFLGVRGEGSGESKSVGEIVCTVGDVGVECGGRR